MTGAEEREAQNELDRRAAVWEHRRWQAALSLLAAMLSSGTLTTTSMARMSGEAVQLADALIAAFDQPAPAVKR